MATSPNNNNSVAWDRHGRTLFAGGASGVLTKTSVAPIERIKILLQVQGIKIKTKVLSNSQYEYGTSFTDAVKKVWSQDGVRGLYRGNGANCLRVIPVYALKFSLNDFNKTLLCKPGQSVNSLAPAQLMLAGMLAGGMQISLTYPMELVRSRLVMGPALGSNYNGILDCARKVVKSEGPIRGLFKGFLPTFGSGMFYIGFQMTFYDLFSRNVPDRENILWKLVAGAAAGVCAQSITYPADTVRRRMQGNGVNGCKREYVNALDCAKKTVFREGPLSLYRGMHVAFMRVIPGAAIQFAAFDYTKKILGVHN